MEALDLPDDGLEIKIRAQALAKEVDLLVGRKFQNKVLSLAHNTKYLEASVTGFFPGFIRGKSRALLPQLPSSYYTLFKALQYVIQNGIVVSLSPNIPGICPADEVLLVHILEAICYLFVE
uniref:Uncharacterized protein n=1 Tax=Amphimedon queenslandica TaxID=400682 RepID=A0A1X7V4N9_AMPQE